MSTDPNRLAIHGGPKTRSIPMPGRLAFGDAELAAVQEIFSSFRERNLGVGHRGYFQQCYWE